MSIQFTSFGSSISHQYESVPTSAKTSVTPTSSSAYQRDSILDSSFDTGSYVTESDASTLSSRGKCVHWSHPNRVSASFPRDMYLNNQRSSLCSRCAAYRVPSVSGGTPIATVQGTRSLDLLDKEPRRIQHTYYHVKNTNHGRSQSFRQRPLPEVPTLEQGGESRTRGRRLVRTPVKQSDYTVLKKQPNTNRGSEGLGANNVQRTQSNTSSSERYSWECGSSTERTSSSARSDVQVNREARASTLPVTSPEQSVFSFANRMRQFIGRSDHTVYNNLVDIDQADETDSSAEEARPLMADVRRRRPSTREDSTAEPVDRVHRTTQDSSQQHPDSQNRDDNQHDSKIVHIYYRGSKRWRIKSSP